MLNKIGHLLLQKAPDATKQSEPEPDYHTMAMHAAARHFMHAMKSDDHEAVARALHHFHTISATAPEQAMGDGDAESE